MFSYHHLSKVGVQFMTFGEPATSNFLLLCILSTPLLWVYRVTMFWIFNPLIAREQRKCLMDLSCRLQDFLICLNGMWYIFWKYWIPCSVPLFFSWPCMESMAQLWDTFLLIHSSYQHLTLIWRYFQHFCLQDWLNYSQPFDPYMNIDKGIKF